MRTLAFVLGLLCSVANAQDAPVAPAQHRRGPEQTFLTYPEWFLVHSPAEYAQFVKERPPTLFPFFGHIRQFWQGYGAVHDATKKDYPFNFGYHVMVMVIGVSTTVEYALRAAYETLIGRLSELAARGLTEEDRYGAAVARDYVDFIRVQPWYEYDFAAKLRGLWQQTSLWGPSVLRKWERKYALSTEYLVKGIYGWLIKKATKASYEEPLQVTAVVLDRMPAGIEKDLPQLKVLQPLANGAALVLVPRYDAFTGYAIGLASREVQFSEIAGNRSVILVSALVPSAWTTDSTILFTQPILTQPQTKRVGLVVPVASLAGVLNRLAAAGARIEHVYDY
jgi:hypothetical protein